MVEGLGLLLADQIGDAGADDVLLTQFSQLQHIAFLQHPAAQPHAAQDDGLTLFIDDPRAVRAQEALRLRQPSRQTQRRRCDRSRNPVLPHDVLPT
jgi:hypothetical protein